MYFIFPKAIEQNDNYSKLSSDAKILYMYIYDRYRLSVSNDWKDESGKPYIYFSRAEMSRVLSSCERTAIRAFAQLKKAGLVRAERCKAGCSPRLYVTDLLNRAELGKAKAPEPEIDEWELAILKSMAAN